MCCVTVTRRLIAWTSVRVINRGWRRDHSAAQTGLSEGMCWSVGHCHSVLSSRQKHCFCSVSCGCMDERQNIIHTWIWEPPTHHASSCDKSGHKGFIELHNAVVDGESYCCDISYHVVFTLLNLLWLV